MANILGRLRSEIRRRRVVHALWPVIMLSGGIAFAGEGSTTQTEGGGVVSVATSLILQAEGLPLTLHDVAYLALLNNREIKIERLTSRIAEQEIRREGAVFHPIYSLESSTSNSQSASGTALAGISTPQAESVNWSSSLKAKLLSGAVASLDFINSKTDGNSEFLTLNPQYSSSLAFTLTQPLLKDFGPRINTIKIKVATNTLGISRYQLQSKVANILTDVENTYWDLVLAFKDMEIRRRALQLTHQLAQRTKELVDEGLLPETANLQARVSVVQREGDVLVAENALRDTLSRLKELLNLGPGADLPILPLDQPTLETKNIDIPQAVKDALRRRPEIPQVKLDLENKNLTLDFAKNQQLPQLNLFGSYGWSGLAGTPTGPQSFKISVPIFRGRSLTFNISTPILTTGPNLDGGYGTSLENLFSGDFPAWKVGMNLTIPLGNVAAKSLLTRAELDRQKSELTLQNVETAIVLEVERAANQVQTALKLIDVAKALKDQTQRRLDMIQEQFDLGLASMSAVVEAQRDLAAAEREEIKSLVDYNKLLAVFGRATGITLEKYRVDL